VGISEVHIDDLHPQRWLTLPRPLNGAPVDVVALSRDPDRFPCSQVRTALVCNQLLQGRGEDGDSLARRLVLTDPATYAISATASLRREDAAWRALLEGTGVGVRVSPPPTGDPAEGSGALADGDPATTWVSSAANPVIHLTLARPRQLRTMRLELNPGAPASTPQRLLLRSDGRRAVVDVGLQGKVLRPPHWWVRHLTIRVESVHPALAPTGTSYRTLPPGVSEVRINGSSLSDSAFHTVTVPCGRGPKIQVGHGVFDTTLNANARDLLRGASVPLELCGSHVSVLGGHVEVGAGPTSAFRVDSVTLARRGARLASATPVVVHRDRSTPSAVDLPARSTPQVLSLPQNLNRGFQATLDGRVLRPQAVDSWQQGWVVPPGAAGTVHLRFAPQRPFDVLLVLGGVLLLVVVIAALPRRRPERELPALSPAPPSRVDLVVVAAAMGFLLGWVGLAALGLTWFLHRRYARLRDWWVYVAGLELLVATAALTWGPLKATSWALDWAQVWAALAVATVSVVLLAPGTRGRRGSRTAPAASSSARS
jgi:arabinofuranan 3-O-arabinosyltransferase